jgi:hypothetical protein
MLLHTAHSIAYWHTDCHNETQHNDTYDNKTQHNNKKKELHSKMTFSMIALEYRYAECRSFLIVMLSFQIVSVTMLSVVTPAKTFKTNKIAKITYLTSFKALAIEREISSFNYFFCQNLKKSEELENVRLRLFFIKHLSNIIKFEDQELTLMN